MAHTSIPVVDLQDFLAGGPRRERFSAVVGESLADIGFFAVVNHGIDGELTQAAYAQARALFGESNEVKRRYESPASHGQRGYTSFGKEHAKDSDAPDLKEFFQVGRPDVADDHPVHGPYGPNLWPDDVAPAFRDVMTRLYTGLDNLGSQLLRACAEWIGEPEDLFASMTRESDTILRVIHYPPVPADAPAGSLRAAAHEDINLITLLSGATAEGLELLQRDGTWLAIEADHDTIVVDTGDMMQNVTNGLLRSTTHRVVNPADGSTDRFSMPCFIHPRKDVDLTPLPGCVARTGNEARFPSVTAGEYLRQRLAEIGLGT